MTRGRRLVVGDREGGRMGVPLCLLEGSASLGLMVLQGPGSGACGWLTTSRPSRDSCAQCSSCEQGKREICGARQLEDLTYGLHQTTSFLVGLDLEEISKDIEHSKGLSPIHLSFENLTCSPPPSLTKQQLRQRFFTFMRPAKKWESTGLNSTRDSVLHPRYLFLRSWCQIPFSLYNLHNHLQRRLAFILVKSNTPKPPWSLGGQIISHLGKCYFFLSCSSCQKKKMFPIEIHFPQYLSRC